MDTAELDRIVEALIDAIAEARALAATAPAVNDELRYTIRHPREMRHLFVEALIQTSL